MELFIGIFTLISLIIIIFLVHTKVKENKEPIIVPQQVTVNLKPLQDAINDLPGKVLQSITSSTNTHKGALGELIGYLQLHASYDRIIPLGGIVDFICIKFPDNKSEGHIDFVDIKTGNYSRLSKEQRLLQKLIDNHLINFIKLKVETTTENADKS